MSTSRDISKWLSSCDAPSDIRKAAGRRLSTRAHDPTPSSKLNAAVEIVRQILAEDVGKLDVDRRKIIVFCLWVGMWPTIEAYFAFENIPIVLLSGGDTAAARSSLLTDFQKDGPHSTKDGRDSWVAMITSSYSAGVNMTRASVLVQLVRGQLTHITSRI
jgi:SNF2 family DNA or RNA helicase